MASQGSIPLGDTSVRVIQNKPIPHRRASCHQSSLSTEDVRPPGYSSKATIPSNGSFNPDVGLKTRRSRAPIIIYYRVCFAGITSPQTSPPPPLRHHQLNLILMNTRVRGSLLCLSPRESFLYRRTRLL